MLQLCVLSSGSKANCTYVYNGNVRLLVDCGLSCKQVVERLRSIDVEPEQIDGILVSHEHSDHVKGLSVFSRRYPARVYINKATRVATNALDNVSDDRIEIFDSSTPFCIDELKVTPCSVSHDAADPVAFRLDSNGKSVGIVTDLGKVTPLIIDHVRLLDGLVIESNYDVDELWNCSYPWEVKQRINSRHGHLSNCQTADFLHQIAEGNLADLKFIIAGHLSENSNTPEKALSALREGWSRQSKKALPHIEAASISSISGIFTL